MKELSIYRLIDGLVLNMTPNTDCIIINYLTFNKLAKEFNKHNVRFNFDWDDLEFYANEYKDNCHIFRYGIMIVPSKQWSDNLHHVAKFYDNPLSEEDFNKIIKSMI